MDHVACDACCAHYVSEGTEGFLGMLLHACFVLSLACRLVPDSELKLSAASAAPGLRRAAEMPFPAPLLPTSSDIGSTRLAVWGEV